MPSFMATIGGDATGLQRLLSELPRQVNRLGQGIRKELNSVFAFDAKGSKSTLFNPVQARDSVREYGEWWQKTLTEQSVRAATRSNEAARLVRNRAADRDKGEAVARQNAIDSSVEAATRSNRARSLMRERAETRRANAEEAARNSVGGRIKSFFGGVAGQFVGIGAAIGAIYKTKEFIADSVRVDIAMQQMFNTLKTVSGSAVQAEKDIQFLRGASNDLGFSFLESGRAFARFSVAATASKLSSEETRKVFLGVQQAALVMGLTTDQTSASMLALEQMLSKGTVMSQELRLQLGNAMPGAVAIFARALGLSQAELYKFVEKGVVPAKEAVMLFGEELKKSFVLTPEANATQRELERMKNSITELKAAIGAGLRIPVQIIASGLGWWAGAGAGAGKTPGGIGPALKKILGITFIEELAQDYSNLGTASVDEGYSSPGFTKAALRLAKLKRDQANATTKADKDKLTRQIKQAELDTDAAKDAEKAIKMEDELSQKQAETHFKSLSKEQQIEELLRRRKAIFQAGMDTKSRSGRAQAGIDIEDIDQELLALRAKGPKEQRAGRSNAIPVTDWQTHGSYVPDIMGTAMQTNPILDVNRQQLTILQRIDARAARSEQRANRSGSSGGATF